MKYVILFFLLFSVVTRLLKAESLEITFGGNKRVIVPLNRPVHITDVNRDELGQLNLPIPRLEEILETVAEVTKQEHQGNPLSVPNSGIQVYSINNDQNAPIEIFRHGYQGNPSFGPNFGNIYDRSQLVEAARHDYQGNLPNNQNSGIHEIQGLPINHHDNAYLTDHKEYLRNDHNSGILHKLHYPITNPKNIRPMYNNANRPLPSEDQILISPDHINLSQSYSNLPRPPTSIGQVYANKQDNLLSNNGPPYYNPNLQRSNTAQRPIVRNQYPHKTMNYDQDHETFNNQYISKPTVLNNPNESQINSDQRYPHNDLTSHNNYQMPIENQITNNYQKNNRNYQYPRFNAANLKRELENHVPEPEGYLHGQRLLAHLSELPELPSKDHENLMDPVSPHENKDLHELTTFIRPIEPKVQDMPTNLTKVYDKPKVLNVQKLNPPVGVITKKPLPPERDTTSTTEAIIYSTEKEDTNTTSIATSTNSLSEFSTLVSKISTPAMNPITSTEKLIRATIRKEIISNKERTKTTTTPETDITNSKYYKSIVPSSNRPNSYTKATKTDTIKSVSEDISSPKASPELTDTVSTESQTKSSLKEISETTTNKISHKKGSTYSVWTSSGTAIASHIKTSSSSNAPTDITSTVKSTTESHSASSDKSIFALTTKNKSSVTSTAGSSASSENTINLRSSINTEAFTVIETTAMSIAQNPSKNDAESVTLINFELVDTTLVSLKETDTNTNTKISTTVAPMSLLVDDKTTTLSSSIKGTSELSTTDINGTTNRNIIDTSAISTKSTSITDIEITATEHSLGDSTSSTIIETDATKPSTTQINNAYTRATVDTNATFASVLPTTKSTSKTETTAVTTSIDRKTDYSLTDNRTSPITLELTSTPSNTSLEPDETAKALPADIDSSTKVTVDNFATATTKSNTPTDSTSDPETMSISNSTHSNMKPTTDINGTTNRNIIDTSAISTSITDTETTATEHSLDDSTSSSTIITYSSLLTSLVETDATEPSTTQINNAYTRATVDTNATFASVLPTTKSTSTTETTAVTTSIDLETDYFLTDNHTSPIRLELTSTPSSTLLEPDQTAKPLPTDIDSSTKATVDDFATVTTNSNSPTEFTSNTETMLISDSTNSYIKPTTLTDNNNTPSSIIENNSASNISTYNNTSIPFQTNSNDTLITLIVESYPTLVSLLVETNITNLGNLLQNKETSNNGTTSVPTKKQVNASISRSKASESTNRATKVSLNSKNTSSTITDLKTLSKTSPKKSALTKSLVGSSLQTTTSPTTTSNPCPRRKSKKRKPRDPKKPKGQKRTKRRKDSATRFKYHNNNYNSTGHVTTDKRMWRSVSTNVTRAK